MLTTVICSVRCSYWTFLFIIFFSAIAATLSKNIETVPKLDKFDDIINKTCPSLYKTTNLLPNFCSLSKIEEDRLCLVILDYKLQACYLAAKHDEVKGNFTCSLLQTIPKTVIIPTNEIVISLKNSSSCEKLCGFKESRSKCLEIAFWGAILTAKSNESSKQKVVPKPLPKEDSNVKKVVEPDSQKKGPAKVESDVSIPETKLLLTTTPKNVEPPPKNMPQEKVNPETEVKKQELIPEPVPIPNKEETPEDDPDNQPLAEGDGDDIENINDKGETKTKLEDFNPDRDADEDTGDLNFNSENNKEEESKMPGSNLPSHQEPLDNGLFRGQISSGTAISSEDSHFFVYFLTFTCLSVMGYIAFHNKNKILALALEGRRGRGGRRRPNSASYRKLDTSLEEAMMSHPSSAPTTHVIY